MESNNIVRKKEKHRLSHILYGKNSNYLEIIYLAIKIGPPNPKVRVELLSC